MILQTYYDASLWVRLIGLKGQVSKLDILEATRSNHSTDLCRIPNILSFECQMLWECLFYKINRSTCELGQTLKPGKSKVFNMLLAWRQCFYLNSFHVLDWLMWIQNFFSLNARARARACGCLSYRWRRSSFRFFSVDIIVSWSSLWYFIFDSGVVENFKPWIDWLKSIELYASYQWENLFLMVLVLMSIGNDGYLCRWEKW